jgi:hypothetical protein
MPTARRGTSTKEGPHVNPLFQPDVFVIRRKKLSTDKMRIHADNGDFLMYAEQKVKWKSPYTATVKLWADEEKQQQLLVATNAGGREQDNFLEVKDLTTGEVLGGLGLGGGFITDGWCIMDTQGATIAEIESGAGRSLMRMVTNGAIAQKMNVMAGGIKVATMNQKHRLVGKDLRIEVEPGASAMVDKRLLVAVGVLAAAYLAKEDMD